VHKDQPRIFLDLSKQTFVFKILHEHVIPLRQGDRELRYFYLATAFILAGCGNYHESTSDGLSSKHFATLSFEAVRETVFRQQCFECHSKANAPNKGNGINLEDYNTVFSKIGSITSDLDSDRMPKGRPPVPANLKQVVEAWAALGAPVTSDKPFPGSDSKPTPVPKILVGFDQVRDKVFQPYCIRCHGFLSDPTAVKKNLDKILAAIDNPDPDLRMPSKSSPLSDKNKALIKEWIGDGMLLGNEEVRQKILTPYCVRCHGRFTDGATVSKMALDIWAEVWSDDMPRNGGPVPMELKMILDEWFKTGAAN
jgi:mono/diheme cytochrome c family protein